MSEEKSVLIGVFSIIVLFLMFLSSPVGFIGAGERGVRTKFGAVTGEVVGEGIYFKTPFIDSVQRMNIKMQKEQVEASSASKDLQEVKMVVALNYHLKPDNIANIYQNFKRDYGDILISPAIQESVKASTAQFTAEELITKRQEVGNKIESLLIERLNTRGIFVDEISIVDLDFSKSFNTSIEAKVKAEQDALTSKNKLEQIKFEAEQKVVSAQAEAEAIRIQAEAVTSQGGEDYVKLKALEKWNGILPTNWYGGAVLPFIGAQ